MNIQQWNQETFLELKNKYRNLTKQARQYQRQITSSYDESIFLTGEEKSFFKLLQSSCLDFDLILLEIVTDLNCFQLDKVAEVIEIMFKVEKTCLEKLTKQLQAVYSNNKATRTKFTDNVCKYCARSLKEVRLNEILQKTTLTQESLSKQKSKKDQKDAQDIEHFLGNDREEFIRTLEQTLNEKTLSLSKRPADTEETLRSFLNDFKDKNDTSKQNQEKEKIARVLEDIKKQENIEVLAELTKIIRKSLLSSVKEPLLDYADKMSLIKAEKIMAQMNAKKVKVNIEIQTVETNVSQIIRKYENKIKTMTSEISVRKQRTKQLQKQLLSVLLSSSSYTQVLTEAKAKQTIAQQNSKKSQVLRIKIEQQFDEYQKHKEKMIESLTYNYDEQVSYLRTEIKILSQQTDQLRQQNELLIMKRQGQQVSTQTFIIKYQTQGIQTIERQMSKRMSVINVIRQSRISQQTIYQQDQTVNTSTIVLKPMFSLQQPTEQEKDKYVQKQKQKQKAISTFSFEPFIEAIKKKTYQQCQQKQMSSNSEEKSHRLKVKLNLSEKAVIEIKIEPNQNPINNKQIQQLSTSESLKGNNIQQQEKKKLPKFGHKSNQSQSLPETAQNFYKIQHVLFGENVSKIKSPLNRTGISRINQKKIETKIQKKSPPQKKQNLRFHNISYTKVQKIHNNKIASVHILPLPIQFQQGRNENNSEIKTDIKTEIKTELKTQFKTQQIQLKIDSQQQVIQKQIALKQIPHKFQYLNSKVQHLHELEQVKKELQIFKSLNQQNKLQKNKNLSLKTVNYKRKQFYIDHNGDKIVIKDKLNEIKNVLLYEFQFLNRIGVIEILDKLSKRRLNHGRIISQYQRNNYKQNPFQITLQTKDFGLFGGYQNALKYQIGKGLWSSELHTEMHNDRVNNIILHIQGLGSKQYEKVSNFIMYPIRFVIFQTKQINIKSNHLRVLLNIIYNYHNSFCDNCNHIKDFLQTIGYL